MVKRKGLGQANTFRTNNNTSTGYGVAYADEVSGHRTVGSPADLYVLHDWQLSASGENTDNDAIGQLWYVVNADGNGNGCYYQLKDWSKRNEAAGWSIADYTTKAELGGAVENINTELDKKEDTTSVDQKLSLKADLEEFNNTVSSINTNIATKANAQDVTNAIGELQDKIGDRVVVSGNVTNNPDEEDITTEGDTPQTQVLKLKDRAYDRLNASGKGYKILRKNWQPINGERKNVLTQAMINEPNTIYEIRYDFDLDGEEISIPKNCVLLFRGGSIDNGTIVFNQTIIDATLYQIFYNVATKGYSPSDCQVEWFGAKAYNKLDTEFTYSSDAIQKALGSCFQNLYFNVGVYYIDKTLEMDCKKSLNFKGSYNGTINTAYNYEINNTNASTLCVLTDIDILHVNCKYNKVPNDISGFISIRGYGILDATKVDNYNSVAVKINVDGIIITNSNIELYVIKKNITFTSIEEAEKEDFGNSIGIELNNSSTKGYSIYGLKINGRIQGFRYGVRNNIPKVCSPTAITFNCQINRCVTAIDFGESGIMGAQVFGEIQTSSFFTDSNKNKYPVFTGLIQNVYFDCYVWDLGLTSNGIFFHNRVMNLSYDDIPVFGEQFKQYKQYIAGDVSSINSAYKYTDFYNTNEYFASTGSYFINFLTDDYAFYQDYNIEKNGINMNGSPFNYGQGGYNGLYVKPTAEDNGKSFKIQINASNVGICKVFLEYQEGSDEYSYFESVDVIYYNSENIQLEKKTYNFNVSDVSRRNYIRDLNVIYGSTVHHVDIVFNNLIYKSSASCIFFIRISGFRHFYKHINTPNRTEIQKDGTFILHGDEFQNVVLDNQHYLLDKTNGAKFYSTAGQKRFFSQEGIETEINKNLAAYGTGCRFYMYNYDEPKLFIFDKETKELFRINMIKSRFKERGTFAEKPKNPYIGYQFFCTDRQTAEGASDGMVIYYKGGNVWVDALGRTVS